MYKPLIIHSIRLALRNSYHADMPIFVPLMMVSVCLMFNFGTLIFLFEGLNQKFDFDFPNKYLFAIITILVVFLLFFYKNKSYKSLLIQAQNKKEKTSTTKSIIVVGLYYALSFLCLLISGMFKNGDL